jgi:hypothetical protein
MPVREPLGGVSLPSGGQGPAGRQRAPQCARAPYARGKGPAETGLQITAQGEGFVIP